MQCICSVPGYTRSSGLVKVQIRRFDSVSLAFLWQTYSRVWLFGVGCGGRTAIPVTSLKVGDEVLVRKQGAARHTGIEIQEFIVEKWGIAAPLFLFSTRNLCWFMWLESTCMWVYILYSKALTNKFAIYIFDKGSLEKAQTKATTLTKNIKILSANFSFSIKQTCSWWIWHPI